MNITIKPLDQAEMVKRYGVQPEQTLGWFLPISIL